MEFTQKRIRQSKSNSFYTHIADFLLDVKGIGAIFGV